MNVSENLAALNKLRKTLGEKPLKSWKEGAAKLAIRVAQARARVAAKAKPAAKPAAKSNMDLTPAAGKLGRPAGTFRKAGDATIQEFAEGLLRKPVSYSDILTAVRAKFPGAHTSPQSLRWYAHQMSRHGAKLPRRPVSSWGDVKPGRPAKSTKPAKPAKHADLL